MSPATVTRISHILIKIRKNNRTSLVKGKRDLTVLSVNEVRLGANALVSMVLVVGAAEASWTRSQVVRLGPHVRAMAEKMVQCGVPDDMST